MKKENYEEYFKGKKVTVLGLGLLGRGLGDTTFLAKEGCNLIVTDRKSKEELASSVKALEEFPAITLRLGEHRLTDFEERDFVLKAAGVPLGSEYIAHAKENGIQVYMSAALVVKILYEKMPSVKVIGITGTRGKSMTTHLVYHLLKHAGKRVHLGGNVRGLANLPLLKEIEEGDFLVLELDSWQLQGFRDLGISPNVAIFTSFLDDHLNYYHGDREAYFNDKASIFVNQKVGDILIASPQAHAEILKRSLGDDAVVPNIKVSARALIGEHNEVSAALAHDALISLDVDTNTIMEGLKTFTGVEGRLEYLGEVGGIHVYNDNNATTPDATLAGIHAVQKKWNKNPLLICGGADKGLDLDHLEKEIESRVKEVVYLSGTGTDKVTLQKKYVYERLEDCIKKVFELALPGDVILFSPGFASFSQHFKNEYERNDEFVRVIKERME